MYDELSKLIKERNAAEFEVKSKQTAIVNITEEVKRLNALVKSLEKEAKVLDEIREEKEKAIKVLATNGL